MIFRNITFLNKVTLLSYNRIAGQKSKQYSRENMEEKEKNAKNKKVNHVNIYMINKKKNA